MKAYKRTGDIMGKEATVTIIETPYPWERNALHIIIQSLSSIDKAIQQPIALALNDLALKYAEQQALDYRLQVEFRVGQSSTFYNYKGKRDYSAL